MTNPEFEKDKRILDLIRLAIEEDLGADDVTSRLLVSKNELGEGALVIKQQGVCCGLPLVPLICQIYDQQLSFSPEAVDGQWLMENTVLGKIKGPMRSLLSAERVILNFLQHLGGVATRTREYVRKVEGTQTKILDTRKTLPGYRSLDKYAVRIGGGENHRMGLYDGLLVKDNHLAGIPLKDLPRQLAGIVKQSRDEAPKRLIEIEVDSLDQLREVLKVQGVDMVLLDNMDVPTLKQGVRMRDGSGSKVLLEASGGVNMSTVRKIAETGVDRISIGELTHSSPAVDIALEVYGITPSIRLPLSN